MKCKGIKYLGHLNECCEQLFILQERKDAKIVRYSHDILSYHHSVGTYLPIIFINVIYYLFIFIIPR